MTINLNVPINSLGYGVVGYNVWNSLDDIKLLPISGRIELPVIPTNAIVDRINKDIELSEFNAENPCLKIWHENQLFERVGKGTFFAYPFFERSKFDNVRKASLNSVDYIFSSSQWAINILRANGISENKIIQEPVRCGVDRSIFNETNNKVNTNQCVFFNCGKWEVRKGHDILHRAFKDAFPKGNEPVELWMMTENPFLKPEEKSRWEALYDFNRVKLINRVRFQQDLAEIMNQTYCGVFPSRAEGWNLEALEMMACGKEIIITDCSAHTEFCNDTNSLLIKDLKEEPMFDGKWFQGPDNGVWASLEGNAYDQLVQNMRLVYEQWRTNPFANNLQGIETSKAYNWTNTANTINKFMRQEGVI